MTTRKTKAVVEDLTNLDIHLNKCTNRGARKEDTDSVCEEGGKGGGEEDGKSRLI
jgi:hypothetical protein